MIKKAVRALSVLVLILLLSACSSISIPGLDSLSTGQTQASTSVSTVQNKLGFGILKLGETGLAVSAEQASTLLPLWMAVKSMGADSSASQAEIAALYVQIEEALTPEQVQAIEQMTQTQEEIMALVQKYGTAVQAGVQSTQNQSSTQAQAQGGPPDGGGMPGGDVMMGVGITSQTGSTQTQQTSQTASSPAGNGNISNVMLADPVVTMLKQIASE